MIVAQKRFIFRLGNSSIPLSALLILLWATPAPAIQTHDGMEGLVSHQFGHILFIFGMTTLLVSIFRRRLKGPGWAQFKTFLFLAGSWNLITFAGHWLNGSMAPEYFIYVNDRLSGFQITGLSSTLFYLSNLDHLLLVPAFLFLLLALLQWRNAP
jgi:hypothetical protein